MRRQRIFRRGGMVSLALVGMVLGWGGPSPSPPERIVSLGATTAPAASTRTGPVQAVLDRWLAGQPGIGSVTAAMAFTGESGPFWTGEAHRGEPLLRVDDEYGVLSITKTFTEALVLREVAAGRIDLDAPVPAIAGVEGVAGAPVVTPRMLLQHTSGLVNYPGAVGYDADRSITPQEIVSLSLRSPRTAPPGQQALYSNTNFHWLGLLLEQVTGRSFGDLVDRIAADHGLDRTWLDPAARPGWVGYSSGGIRSTVRDLARWGVALFTPGRVLPGRQVAELTAVGAAGTSLGLWPVCPCSTGPDGERHPAALRQSVAHGGFYFFPDQGLVIVLHHEPAAPAATDAAAIGLARAVGGPGRGAPAG